MDGCSRRVPAHVDHSYWRLTVVVGAVVDVHDQQDHTGRTVDLIDDAVVAPTRCITTGELQLKLASDPPGIARKESYLDLRGWLAHQTAQLSSRPVGIEQLELSPDPS